MSELKQSTLVVKTNISGILLSVTLALSLLAADGRSAPKEVQVPPSKVVPAEPAKAAQAERTNSAAVPAPSVGAIIQFTPRPGSKMRIRGSQTMIGCYWRLESPFIMGHLDAGPGFPTEPGQVVTPGKVAAKADVAVPVNSLKSIEEDGTHYSDAMDNIIREKLKADAFKKIEYHLTELALKEAAWRKDIPYLFEAKGDLVVAGVTNAITMPVEVLPLGDRKLKIAGAISVKMTSFNIAPPTALGGQFRVYDEVKLSFEWMVAQKGTATAIAPGQRSPP